jgi:hypothetical protein
MKRGSRFPRRLKDVCGLLRCWPSIQRGAIAAERDPVCGELLISVEISNSPHTGHGTAAWLRFRGLRGRFAQHKLATRLEGRALDGRLSHQFGSSDGLRRVALPVRLDGATAILRIAFIVLLVVNLIPLGQLFANLQPTHARLYTRKQQWLVGVLIFAAGTLIPLGLMLLNGGLLSVFGSVVFVLVVSWVIRFVYVKIPHTSPLEIRIGE